MIGAHGRRSPGVAQSPAKSFSKRGLPWSGAHLEVYAQPARGGEIDFVVELLEQIQYFVVLAGEHLVARDGQTVDAAPAIHVSLSCSLLETHAGRGHTPVPVCVS